MCPLLVTLLSAFCAASAPAWGAEVIGVPRVALIYSDFGDFRHRDDYDAVFKSLGWSLEKVENRDFGRLAERLGEYDILLGSALFNYSNVQDFAQYREALFRFMERGGAVVWTDTNYAPMVDWLERLGPDWSVKLAACKTTSTPMKSLDVTHPIFSLSQPIRALSPTWMHMLPASGWQVISTCEDGEATGLFRYHGRGFMMCTSYWGYSSAQLRNIWETLRCSRHGLGLTVPDVTGFDLGENRAAAGVRNLTGRPMDFAMRATLVAAGKEETVTGAARLEPGAPAQTVQVTVPITQRGAQTLTIVFQADGAQVCQIGPVELTIPELLTVSVTEPVYRGTVYLAHPPERIAWDMSLHRPDQPLHRLQVAAALHQQDTLLAELPARPVEGLRSEASVPVRVVAPGDLTLTVYLLQEGQADPVAQVTRRIPVIPARRPQVTIDGDLVTRVNGEPFFPITVYHIGQEDYPRARALGFNSIQAWGSSIEQARSNLDAAAAHGLLVVLESVSAYLGDRPVEELQPWLQALESHPALLAWYSTDEPSGDERFAWCQRVYDYMVANEPHHPVYLTSCSPGEFQRYAAVTDILAVDPYPIPSSVTLVSNWMRTAQQAVRGRQPVWLIPQAFSWAQYKDPAAGGVPTPEQERNMVYQGLIWGAKGIFYYTWDDGTTGIKYDQPLQDAVGRINAELAQLGPELLKCTHRITAMNDEVHPDLYAAVFSGDDVVYILAASVSDDARSFEVPADGVADQPLEVLFEERQSRVVDGVVRDEFAPLEVHVYRGRR